MVKKYGEMNQKGKKIEMRRLRAFKRWMKSQRIEWSDGLEFIEDEGGISVKAAFDLNEGDLVATIPKNACLTIKTSAATELIEEFKLGGSLGLSVALMYEISLGEASNWAGYLQLLPERECVPLVWTLDEVDELLSGTELHKTIKEDKTLIYEDWKENILPLLASGQLDHDQKSFGVEQYFAAKSLVSSRSFEIDEYHGYGMVPLADLFNHKTGAENVHFTRSSDSDSDGGSDVEDIQDDDHDGSYDSSTVEDVDFNINGSSEDDPTTLEMIVVKSVKAGNEVYNTYGTMGNAALLHRYGFTELDNGFDIVNIDLKLVLKWSSSLLSGRQSRARLSLWRRLGCVGCISGNSEYFEISSDGEPQLELLILIYIISLSEKTYDKLNHKVQTVVEDINKAISILLLENNKKRVAKKSPEMGKDLLLTQKVRDALVSIADFRESSYSTNLIIEDIETLEKSSPVKNRKLYHSLVLRVSERRILEKLRTYSSNGSSKRSKKKPFLK